FGSGSIVVSFVVEALCIALVGGLVGCAVVLPLNGLTTGTINWQTFSHLAFAFRVTPGLLAMGLAFALLMGLVGGVPPAVRAARLRAHLVHGDDEAVREGPLDEIPGHLGSPFRVVSGC